MYPMMSEMLLEELLKNNFVLRHCCWQWGSCREEQHWEEWWCLSSWESLEILWSYWILKIINSMLKTHWKPLLKGTVKVYPKSYLQLWIHHHLVQDPSCDLSLICPLNQLCHWRLVDPAFSPQVSWTRRLRHQDHCSCWRLMTTRNYLKNQDK